MKYIFLLFAALLVSTAQANEVAIFNMSKSLDFDVSYKICYGERGVNYHCDDIRTVLVPHKTNMSDSHSVIVPVNGEKPMILIESAIGKSLDGVMVSKGHYGYSDDSGGGCGMPLYGWNYISNTQHQYNVLITLDDLDGSKIVSSRAEIYDVY